MSGTTPAVRVGEALERSISIRHIFGDAVTHGGVTVIPVGQVVMAFGGGGGNATRGSTPDAAESSSASYDAAGSGGGGALRMTPLGALEISDAGARFVRLRPVAPLLVAGAIGIALGLLIARRRA